MPREDRTAHRVLTGRLEMRPYRETDAEARRQLIDTNDAWLRPWIPWMREEPMTLDATQAKLREHAEAFASRELFRYIILERNSGAMLGEAGLYPRIGPGGLEAGYLLGEAYAGAGFASEAASAMIRVAFEVENTLRVELHCEPANSASVRVARRLEFTLRETLPRNAVSGDPELMIWTLSLGDYRRSPAHGVLVEAYTATGERLL